MIICKASRLFTIFVIVGSMIFVYEAVVQFAQFLWRYYERKKFNSLNMESEKFSRKKSSKQTYIKKIQVHLGKIKISIMALLIVIFSGVLFFMFNEGWTFISSLYWTMETITVSEYQIFYCCYV